MQGRSSFSIKDGCSRLQQTAELQKGRSAERLSGNHFSRAAMGGPRILTP